MKATKTGIEKSSESIKTEIKSDTDAVNDNIDKSGDAVIDANSKKSDEIYAKLSSDLEKRINDLEDHQDEISKT